MSPHRSPKSDRGDSVGVPGVAVTVFPGHASCQGGPNTFWSSVSVSLFTPDAQNISRSFQNLKKFQNGFNIIGILAQHHSNLTLGQKCFRPNPHGLEHPTRRMTGCPSAANHAAWQCSVPCQRLHAVIPRDWMGIDGNYHGIG